MAAMPLSAGFLAGDRGMLTSARIEQALHPAGLDWITALRAPQSGNWRTPGRYNSPRSTLGIWPRSAVRTIPASGWWRAEIRCWPRKDGVSATNCWH
jgi:hypothetical protein